MINREDLIESLDGGESWRKFEWRLSGKVRIESNQFYFPLNNYATKIKGNAGTDEEVDEREDCSKPPNPYMNMCQSTAASQWDDLLRVALWA